MKKIVSVFFMLNAAVVLSPVFARAERLHFDFGPKSKLDAKKIDTEIRTFDLQMIQAAQIAEANARSRSHRHCWRAVKNAMLEAAVLDDRPTTKYAKQAGDELEQKFGFKKLAINDPFEAPIGAVLVYGGRGAGHVEIRTADGFVSDVVSSHPSHRPLIGIYVRV